jgi:hypothetical protein
MSEKNGPRELDGQDIPEIGSMGNEYPEIGGMADEYPEIGATLGMLQQSMLPVKLALAKGAEEGTGIGPQTTAKLSELVARHSAQIADLRSKVGLVTVRQPSPMGYPGRGKAHMPVPLSDPGPGAGAPLALAKATGVAFRIVNTRSGPVDLTRLDIEITDPATGLPAGGCTVTGLFVNSDVWGDGQPTGAGKFAPTVQDPIPLNKRVNQTAEAVRGVVYNGTALALVFTATVWAHEAPGVSIGNLGE